MKENGVCGIVNNSVDLKTAKVCIDFCEKYDFMYGAVGFHPENLEDMPNDYLDRVAELLKHKKIVAVGETGLDYHWDISKDLQNRVFEEQIKLSLDVNIPGKFNVYNALAAISAVSFFDIPDKAIVEGLHKAKVKGRVEPVPVPGNYSLIIDYAHNALSMENVLSTLRLYKPNRLITMFGAGGNRPKVRRYEMGETSGRLSDLSVITEDNSRFEDVMDIIEDIKTGLAKTDGKYVVVPNRKDAIRYCMENAQDGDIIVLAGKGHEDYQEIKGVKYHMDERELVADIIKEMSEKSK